MKIMCDKCRAKDGPCVVDVQGLETGAWPHYCLWDGDDADWKEMKESDYFEMRGFGNAKTTNMEQVVMKFLPCSKCVYGDGHDAGVCKSCHALNGIPCNFVLRSLHSPSDVFGKDTSCVSWKTRPSATPEPMSKPGDDDVLPEVINDLKAREDLGIKKYGTTLQTNNGRDALNDLYQEILDAAMYAKQAIMESNKCSCFENWQNIIRDWANERGLYSAVTNYSQFKKMIEESVEWIEAADTYDNNTTDENKVNEMMEIGDMLVVLTNKAESRGYSLHECGMMAYEKIKNRTGHIENGSFVKDNL